MKTSLALVAALCPFVASINAQLTAVDPAYSAIPFFSHSNTDNIVSYDWGVNGNIYYQTSANFMFGGFYQRGGSGAITQIVPPSSMAFPGASVVSVGQNVYFNTSDFSNNQNIYKYGLVANTPATTFASTTPNYGLYQNQGRLFITGAPGFGTNHIYYSNLDASGNLLSNPAVDLGQDSGSSGPLAFDQAGDLYYAPGFGDLSIYRWSAADVAAAIANPGANPLSSAGHLWLNYSALYGMVSGGTSMLLDQQGNLLLTLTNFSGPSVLAKFGVGANGAYTGVSDTLFQDSGVIGELRLHDNDLYLSSDNQILQIVPEPAAAYVILVAGLLVALCYRHRAVPGSYTVSLGSASNKSSVILSGVRNERSRRTSAAWYQLSLYDRYEAGSASAGRSTAERQIGTPPGGPSTALHFAQDDKPFIAGSTARNGITGKAVSRSPRNSGSR